MAHPRKTPKGWYVDVRIDGRRHQRTFATKSEAQRYYDELIASRYSRNSVDPDRSPTMADVCNTFLTYQRARVRSGTITSGALREVETHIRNLLPMPVNDRTLAEVRVGRITKAMIRHQVIPAILDGRAPKTARNYYSTFKLVMKFAAEDDLIGANPAADLTIEAPVERVDRAERIAKPVVRSILEACDDADRLLIKFAMQTGLRAGEQAVLRWADIDLEKRVVYVERARKKDGSIGPTKTKAGRRQIDIGPSLALELKKWKLEQPVEQRRFGLVFPTAAGTHEVSADNWRNRILAPACDRAGVERLRWHDLRHVFASTMMFDLNWSDAVMTQMMGHASIDLFRKTYAHWRTDTGSDQDRGRELEEAMR